MTTPTLDDLLGGLTVVPARSSAGRSTEDVTLSRRLRVLDLYSSGLTRQVYEYVEALGFSRATAADDLKWARAEWQALNTNDNTAQEIIALHSAKYYEWSEQARVAGDLKLAKEMLQAIEKLRGFHQANVAVQVNNIQATTHNTQVNFNYDALSLEEQLRWAELVAKALPPATDATAES